MSDETLDDIAKFIAGGPYPEDEIPTVPRLRGGMYSGRVRASENPRTNSNCSSQ